MYVALTQTASSLPFFLLALPAGSAGDIFDRRKLILYTEGWMACVALALAVPTIGGLITPWLLLGLTFALSAGDAFATPTWRAVLPELVPKENLAVASALNGIEFNLARAVGPALAGLLIVGCWHCCGICGERAVILRSHPSHCVMEKADSEADRAGWNPCRGDRGGDPLHPHSPAIRSVMVRTGAGMFFASALFALLPTVARGVSDSAIGYGLLLGCFGAGAILGALVMQPLRTRWSTEAVVSAGVTILGVAIVTTGASHRLGILGPVILIGGGAWILFISLVNALIQNLAPDWVRARVLAVFILIS